MFTVNIQHLLAIVDFQQMTWAYGECIECIAIYRDNAEIVWMLTPLNWYVLFPATTSLIEYSLEGARELQVDYVNKLMFWIIDDKLEVSSLLIYWVITSLSTASCLVPVCRILLVKPK